MGMIKDESGAVTVDWVVLTAGLVGLGLAVMSVVSTGVQDASGDTEQQLSGGTIITTSFSQYQNASLWDAYNTYATWVQTRPPEMVWQGHSDPAWGFENEMENLASMEDDELLEMIGEFQEDEDYWAGQVAMLETWNGSDKSIETMVSLYPHFGDAASAQAILDGQFSGDADAFMQMVGTGAAYEALLLEAYEAEAAARDL